MQLRTAISLHTKPPTSSFGFGSLSFACYLRVREARRREITLHSGLCRPAKGCLLKRERIQAQRPPLSVVSCTVLARRSRIGQDLAPSPLTSRSHSHSHSYRSAIAIVPIRFLLPTSPPFSKCHRPVSAFTSLPPWQLVWAAQSAHTA